MNFNNVEIKARSTDLSGIRSKLKELKAREKGLDHQIDTYFKVSEGKLKLREGNVENSLILYKRQKKKGPKLSSVTLYEFQPNNSSLKDILTQTIGIDIIVDKKREIYFIDNIKFHLDQVKGLGSFVEIEARDYESTIGKKKLLAQCNAYLKILGINQKDLVVDSYSDLLLTSKV